MKKNAFTLIETIGVIIVIALVATVTIPIIINSNDRDRVAEQESADLKSATQYYLENHPELKEKIKTDGEIYISVTDLKNEGLIHDITKFNVVKIQYVESGTYNITPEMKFK